MKKEYRKIEGDYVIKDEFVLHGMITGNTFVVRGGELELKGMICRNLTIEEGGKAVIHGMVLGNVINNTGSLAVYGMVLGTINSIKGETYIDEKACIRNIIIPEPPAS